MEGLNWGFHSYIFSINEVTFNDQLWNPFDAFTDSTKFLSYKESRATTFNGKDD